MVLHYAHLCAAAGDAFLIGTEMRGLTRADPEFDFVGIDNYTTLGLAG
jgi:hypothetical protein